MTNEQQTSEQQSLQTTTRSYRRDLMKLLGAGTAVGAFGGVAAADGRPSPQVDEPDEDETDEPAEDAETSDGGTVHVVRTLITQSTNPERPADFFYQPTGLQVEPGDVVKFVFETPDHNVTSYHPAFGMQRRIPAGVQPFSSPIMGWAPESLPDDIEMPPAEGGEPDDGAEEPTDENGDDDEMEAMDGAGEPTPSSWLYAFETPGVYDLECAPHEGFGMAMRVVVGEETETNFETSNADELPPPRVGPVGFARQVLTDPSLAPDAIVEAGRVEWVDLEMNQGGENGSDGDATGEENGSDDDAEDGAENGTVDDSSPDGAENGDTADDGNVTDENGDT